MSKNFEIIENWSTAGNIRNISIISHVDHGKTTLSDHFIASSGILPKHLAGQMRALDYLPEEQKRGITIESSYSSLVLDWRDEQYLINLIDTPGHVDFSGKVAESLRLVDGALVLVDAVEGIMAQTKTVLRQAIKEQVRLILFVNKIDRLITELNLTEKKIKERIQRIIGEIHAIFLKFGVDKSLLPNFLNGSIILGSAIDGWAIDFEYGKNGGKISQIVESYKNQDILDLKQNLSVMDILIRNIISILPSPRIAQRKKYPQLFVSKPEENVLTKIYEADPEDKLIVLVGRSYRIQNIGKVAYIVRLLSGSMQRGTIVKASNSSKKIRVTKLFQIVGKSIKDVKKVKSGQIAGIILSKPVIPGDILSSIDLNIPEMIDISYVQDPVVAISIEPLELKQIGKLEIAINNICEVTPGLIYEVNKDTGELLAMGVGTLQLEILQSELEEQNFNLEISDPRILKFEMPTQTCMFEDTKRSEITGTAGMTENIDVDLASIYSDNQNNHLITKIQINHEAENGLIEVFRQYMRVSPYSTQRIKNFTLVLDLYPQTKKLSTYENGIIIGSSIIKSALKASNVKIHQPFYELEINIPEEFLGSVLHELQKNEIIVEKVESINKEALVKGKLPVKVASKLADQLRQITDGNAFWSFSKIIFQPIVN